MKPVRLQNLTKAFLIILTLSAASIASSITKLEIEPASLELREGQTVDMKVIAHYDDNTSGYLDKDIDWSVANTQFATVETNGTLTAVNEGITSVTVNVGNTDASAGITVYKEIHGHRLPPEPDPTVNNSTLLGIDSNNNGVRDDVERQIYLSEKYIYPVVRAIALQAARAFNVLLTDVSKARDTFQYLKAAMDCESYFKIYASFFNEPTLIDRKRWVVGEIESMQINTKQRKTMYQNFNVYLSGSILTATPDNELKNQCDFNTTQINE